MSGKSVRTASAVLALVLVGGALAATLAGAAGESPPAASPERQDAGGSATLTVTKTDDTFDGVCDADCSLREAIAVAASGDSITIPAGTYTLTLGSQLVINKSLSLNGTGSGHTIIQAAANSGDAKHRVFNITSGNVFISGVTIRLGKTSENGGGILNSTGANLTLLSTVIRNNKADRGGGIVNTGTLTITNSIINDNDSRAWGGGILNVGELNIATSTVSNNSTEVNGGGIFNAGRGILNPGNETGGKLNISDTTISGNIAGSGGGGIFNTPIGTGPSGGTVTVTNSTINGNSTDSYGGGIFNNHNLILTNTTVSNNMATLEGGGIFNFQSSRGTVALTNSTITDNSAGSGGDGIRNQRGPLTMTNSTVSDNVATATGTLYAANGGGRGNCAGVVTSLGHNLDSDGTCGLDVTGDLPSADPLLGPLQDNGGPTFTHALLPESPAIDAGNPAEPGSGGNACEGTDQRGVARPVDGDRDGTSRCDIGAFEYEPPVAILTVNSADDVDDGACDAAHCSLREAINAANGNAGRDTIAFNIPGPGHHTIQPASVLPTITDPVVIDGYIEAGASPNTNPITTGSNAVLKIELDGSVAGVGVHGLHITAGSSTVRGLVINRFGGSGIVLETTGGNMIEGNFIGTNVTGSAKLGVGWQ